MESRPQHHELTPLQWLGLVLAIAAASAVLLAITAFALRSLMLTLQHRV